MSGAGNQRILIISRRQPRQSAAWADFNIHLTREDTTHMNNQIRRLAVVTGASTGIGFELAQLCVKANYDLIVAADAPGIEEAAADLSYGSLVFSLPCVPSTTAGA